VNILARPGSAWHGWLRRGLDRPGKVISGEILKQFQQSLEGRGAAGHGWPRQGNSISRVKPGDRFQARSAKAGQGTARRSMARRGLARSSGKPGQFLARLAMVRRGEAGKDTVRPGEACPGKVIARFRATVSAISGRSGRAVIWQGEQRRGRAIRGR